MMYSFILLSLVVAVYCHQPVPELYDADKYEAKVKRLDEVEELIDRVTTRIQNLKDKRELRQKQKDDADRRSKSILLRLDRMKLNDGSFHCDKPDKEFKCRKNTQCVNNILVCDNVPDCEDKSDEDPDLCKFPSTLYQYWPAWNYYYHCMDMNVEKYRIQWTNVERKNYLKSSLIITGQSLWTYRLGVEETMDAVSEWKMTYNYGSHTAIAQGVYEGTVYKGVVHFFPEDKIFYVKSYIGMTQEPCGISVAFQP